MKSEKYQSTKEAVLKAEELLSKPIETLEGLKERLEVMFDIQTKLSLINKTANALVLLQSSLNSATSSWAVEHPKIVPLEEIKPGIRQAVIDNYVLTESKGEVNGKEHIYRLWGRIFVPKAQTGRCDNERRKSPMEI